MDDPAVLFSPVIEDGVLAKAREQISRNHELQQRALEGNAVPDSIRQGCDVTLSYMGLTSLPPELIDIIKGEVARLALDNNRLPGLSGLSVRLAECTRLRYLVMRNNQLREFPTSILDVPTLELLDLKGNKITSLPEDLSRLRKLRVFSIYHNRITKVPLCVGQMNSLVHFAARRNPISFPSPDGWMIDETNGVSQDRIREDERIRVETANLKAALLAYSNRERLKVDADSDLSEENVETPRPARRKMGGRFPIIPSHSATDLKAEGGLISPPLISPAFISPALPLKPPAMPIRSAARLPTQPQTATFRPTIAPLITLNERNRSNSESQMSTRARVKRMGVITRKPVAQNSVDLDEKRLSHLRGLSHGSGLQNGVLPSAPVARTSPGSPVDADQRATFIRRLSSLPEGKRKSQMQDPMLELAMGVVYALDQLSAPVMHVIGFFKDSKRGQADHVFRLGMSYLREIERMLATSRQPDEESDEAERAKSSMSVRGSCESCIKVFEQLFVVLQQDIRALVSCTSPQRIRTLMHMLYAGLVEVRNACSKLGIDFQPTPRPLQFDGGRGRYHQPAASRPLTRMRIRDRTPVLLGSRSSSRARGIATPLTQIPPPLSAASRTGSMVSLNSALIRASEPFTPVSTGTMSTAPTRMSRSNTLMSVEESDEEIQFENIYLKLSAACDFAVQALPRCQTLLTESMRTAAGHGSADTDMSSYEAIGDRCRIAMEAADALKRRLGTLKLKEPGVRANVDFWQLCMSFIRAYSIFAARVKDCYHAPVIILPEDVRLLLKPLQRSVKDVSKAINDSAWAALAATPGQQPVSAANKSMTNIAALNNNSNPPNADPSAQPQPQTRSRTQTYTQQQRHPPPLTLATRGANVPPPNPTDPLSATSNHSASGNDAVNLGLGVGGFGMGPSAVYPSQIPYNNHATNPFSSSSSVPASVAPTTGATTTNPQQQSTGMVGSGYVTPLPATPMSAALGPAAGATVPLPVSIPLTHLAAGSAGAGGGAILGGLLPSLQALPTAATGVGAGLLPGAPTAASGTPLMNGVTMHGMAAPLSYSSGMGITNGSHTTINSNINGSSTNSAAQQVMVAGLKGYLNAGAGVAPVSGIASPSLSFGGISSVATSSNAATTNACVSGNLGMGMERGRGMSGSIATPQAQSQSQSQALFHPPAILTPQPQQQYAQPPPPPPTQQQYAQPPPATQQQQQQIPPPLQQSLSSLSVSTMGGGNVGGGGVGGGQYGSTIMERTRSLSQRR